MRILVWMARGGGRGKGNKAALTSLCQHTYRAAQMCMPCRLVKFQKVNVLTIFVGSNQGDEETTIIQRIALTGTSGDTFNVAEIKKVEEH